MHMCNAQGEEANLTWNTSFLLTISEFVDNSMQHS